MACDGGERGFSASEINNQQGMDGGEYDALIRPVSDPVLSGGDSVCMCGAEEDADGWAGRSAKEMTDKQDEVEAEANVATEAGEHGEAGPFDDDGNAPM